MLTKILGAGQTLVIMLVSIPSNPLPSPEANPTSSTTDILGRQSLNELILRVAAGRGDQVKERIESNIMKISEKVEIYDDDV